MLPPHLRKWRWALDGEQHEHWSGLALDRNSVGRGLVAFLIGAAMFKPAEYQVWLVDGLRAMARDRGPMQWLTAWMTCGVVVTLYGLAALRRSFAVASDGAGGTWFFLMFAVGAVCMIGFLVILRTIVVHMPTDPTVEVPAKLLAWRDAGGVLFAVHMLLAYASHIALGVAVLKTGLLPSWFGWTASIGGGVMLLGLVVFRGGPFTPPILAHVMTAVSGIVLLIRPPPLS